MQRPADALASFHEALAAKQTLYELDTNNAEAGNTLANTHRSLCQTYLESDALETALTHCEQSVLIQEAVVNVDPKNAIGLENLSMAYYNLGNKYKALGHYERAVTQYERSLARDPSYLPTWNNLAMTYEQSGGRDVDALETWKRVLEMGRRYGIAKYVERASRRMAGIEERRQSAELPGADAESASP